MKRNNYLKLIGALTSKPYAFNARSWELKSVETIDLFDSLGCNIKLDIRGSQIMRILPVTNEIINEEWISDKSRYAFDGLNKWRYINPMVKKNEFFVSMSWEKTFEFIKEESKSRNINTLTLNSGPFSDIENISTLKELGQKYNYVNYNKTNINFDLPENYLLNWNNIDKPGKKVLIMVGCNLRLENPILNLKLRRLSLKNETLVYYIGPSHNSTIEMTYLGNDLNCLIKILRGRHDVNPIINQFLNKSFNGSKLSSVFSNNFSLLLGSEFLNNLNSKNILNYLENKNVKYNLIHQYQGEVNALELGLFSPNFVKPNKASSKLIYLNGTENSKEIKKNDLVIFQGHHNDSLRNEIDVILPSTNYTEKSSLFINNLGIVQKTKFIVYPPKDVRDDWKINVMLANKLNINLQTYSINKLYNKINNFSINLTKSKNNNHHFFNLNKLTSNSIFKLYSIPLKSTITNFYVTDSTSRASKTMNKCSESFLKLKNNYYN